MGKTLLQIVGLIGFILLLLVIGPLAAIWSLNTLFPTLAIPFTWETWLAASVLSTVVGGKDIVSFNSSK